MHEEKIIVQEEEIQLENDLADELLNCDVKSREEKYTEVYEKSYSCLTKEKQEQLSDNYLKGAIKFSRVIKKAIGSGKLVLDIGCGFGHLSYLIAKEGNSVIGIDINRIHIQEAMQRYANVKDLAFKETKAVKLMFPNNSFDFVLSTSVFEHLHPDDVDTHLSEVYRVLKTGGKYIFTAITPYLRGDIAVYSKAPQQRQKHGFHINEKTWKQFQDILTKHHFAGKTDILPSRINIKMPQYLFLVPLSFKAFLERKLKINDITLRLFKLGGVFIVAQKMAKLEPGFPRSGVPRHRPTKLVQIEKDVKERLSLSC